MTKKNIKKPDLVCEPERQYNRRFFLCAALFFISLCAVGGNRWKISGFVFDSKTKEPIPFVNIAVEDKAIGTISDIDGFFSLTVEEEQCTLVFSHISHEKQSKIFSTADSFPVTILLKPVVYELAEVAILPEENPAHRIIDSLIAHIPDNDPKKLPFYTCSIYEKMVVTMDSTDAEKLMQNVNNDSVPIKFHDYLSDHELFIIENVLEKTYVKPDRNYNKVVATKISGFKEPFFVATLTQLQSVSLYDPTFTIGMDEFISPVSKGTTKRYFFLLQDTTYSEQGDTIFQILYQPRRGTNFNGLHGILSINSNGWALQNATASPRNSDTATVEIVLREMYQQLDNEQWFPYQVHTDYAIKNIGEIISLKAIGRSYYRNVDLSEKPKRLGEVGVALLPDAGKKDTLFWNEYRVSPLSLKENNTYQFIDSLAEAEHLDLFFKMAEALMDQKIKIWKFNIDLDKIINYQEYQGFYLGLGLSTNRDFSRIFELGGFYGYGFRDKETKYGGYASAMIYRPRNLKIKASYAFDGLAVGREPFYYLNKSLLSSAYYEQFFINRVDYTERIGGALFIDPFPYLQTEAGFYHDFRSPSYDYVFEPTGQTEFETTTLQIKMRYAFREGRVSLPHKRSVLLLEKHIYPIISLNYTHGFKDVLSGDFNFNRMEGKVHQNIYWRFIGQTQIVLQGGMMFEDVPYSLLYSPASTYLRNYTVYSQNSFATMRRNEFVNDCYLSLFFSHDFKHLFFKPKGKVSKILDFQPGILTNIGWGTLQKPENHSGIDITDMHLGYFESGIMFRKLLFKLDFGCLYRYGAYSFEKFSDNFVVVMGFGL